MEPVIPRPRLRTLLLTLTLPTLWACAPTSTPTSRTTSPAGASTFDSAAEAEAATALLRRYEEALNRADVASIVSLYAPDAVFMAQHRSPAIGRQQVERAYREIFQVIQLNIAFEIDEVVVASPTVAYARTRSAGTTTLLDGGARVSEGNQELFVLVRDTDAGQWRIGRYIFSTTQPPRG